MTVIISKSCDALVRYLHNIMKYHFIKPIKGSEAHLLKKITFASQQVTRMKIVILRVGKVTL